MTTYSDIVQVCNEENLSIADLDRVIITAETMENFRENIPAETVEFGDYETVRGPAIRETDGQEKVVYVDEDGHEQEVLLD